MVPVSLAGLVTTVAALPGCPEHIPVPASVRLALRMGAMSAKIAFEVKNL
jgi:hypothetical protein